MYIYCSQCGCKMKSDQTICPFCGKAHKVKPKAVSSSKANSKKKSKVNSKHTPPMPEPKKKNIFLCVLSLVLEALAVASLILFISTPYVAHALSLFFILSGMLTAHFARFPLGVALGVLGLAVLAYFIIFFILTHLPSGPSPFPTDISDVYAITVLHIL